jgi:hypothetical protein
VSRCTSLTDRLSVSEDCSDWMGTVVMHYGNPCRTAHARILLRWNVRIGWEQLWEPLSHRARGSCLDPEFYRWPLNGKGGSHSGSFWSFYSPTGSCCVQRQDVYTYVEQTDRSNESSHLLRTYRTATQSNESICRNASDVPVGWYLVLVPVPGTLYQVPVE